MRCRNCGKPTRHVNGHRCWDKYGLCGKCTILLHPSEYVSEEARLRQVLKRVIERAEFYEKKTRYFVQKRDFILAQLEKKTIVVVVR